MKPGNKFYLFFILLFLSFNSFAEDKITSSPLINVDEIKPSFEPEQENEKISINKDLKEKNY